MSILLYGPNKVYSIVPPPVEVVALEGTDDRQSPTYDDDDESSVTRLGDFWKF